MDNPDDETPDERVFRIARQIARMKRRMWVSRRQYDIFVKSKQFTADEIKYFIVVEPWPEPEAGQ